LGPFDQEETWPTQSFYQGTSTMSIIRSFTSRGSLPTARFCGLYPQWFTWDK
jgi:hypothetical protein